MLSARAAASVDMVTQQHYVSTHDKSCSFPPLSVCWLYAYASFLPVFVSELRFNLFQTEALLVWLCGCPRCPWYPLGQGFDVELRGSFVEKSSLQCWNESTL